MQRGAQECGHETLHLPTSTDQVRSTLKQRLAAIASSISNGLRTSNTPGRLHAAPPARPGEVWQADITYVATREGWLYVAGALDACSRRVAASKLMLKRLAAYLY